MIGGILVIIAGIINQMAFMVIAMIAMIIIPAIYSFMLYKKGI